MSDLYLVLRRRLEDVTDWVELGVDTLKDARKAKGLSYEAMGRQLNVASKTWERWEKAGRVPRHELRRVAKELELEISWPAPVTVDLEDDDDGATRDLRREMADIRSQLGRIERLLLAQQDEPPSR